MAEHTNGNGKLRNWIAALALLLGVLAWMFERYDAAHRAEHRALRTSIDSLANDARRFQVNVDRVVRDHETRLPPKREP